MSYYLPTVTITTVAYRDTLRPLEADLDFDLRPFGAVGTAAQVRATPGIRPLVGAVVAAVLAYLDAPWDPQDPDDEDEEPAPITVALGSHDGLAAAVVADIVATILDEEHDAVVTLQPPDRHISPVPPHLRPWDEPYPAYAPVDITPPGLQPHVGLADSVADGWAEPAANPAAIPDAVARRDRALIAHEFDDHGRPLHPGGRTGKIGRNLGKWGENAAADPIVVAGDGPDRRVLLIRRRDCQEWAIPGGMVDPGETAPAALARELREETGIDLAAVCAQILVRTLVNDPRESDWAWVATTVALYRVPDVLPAAAGDDAADARWWPFPDIDTVVRAVADDGGLYEAHRPLLTVALATLDG